MHIPTKISAIKKVNNYPQKYEYCHDCRGSGQSFYVNKFSDGYDGKSDAEYAIKVAKAEDSISKEIGKYQYRLVAML